jgi:hypothetical protein
LTKVKKFDILIVMKNISILRTNIDVSDIHKQLLQYSEDWGNVGRMKGVDRQDPHTRLVKSGVLQLVMGGISKPGEFIGDTEICVPTEAIYRHLAIQRFIVEQNFATRIGRCAFLRTPVGEITGKHIDEGKYYTTKDRYHLSIYGKYRYTVWDDGDDDSTKEIIDVEPGTFFWFNNKKNHMAENTGDTERIVFIFDMPMHDKNPK